jgi:hypothetical protein
LAFVAIGQCRLKGISWMAKSKYDRNVDKGAFQQRNAGQGAQGGYKKPGNLPEEQPGTGQQSGGSKNQVGSARRNQESSWRPKSGGGDNG